MQPLLPFVFDEMAEPLSWAHRIMGAAQRVSNVSPLWLILSITYTCSSKGAGERLEWGMDVDIDIDTDIYHVTYYWIKLEMQWTNFSKLEQNWDPSFRPQGTKWRIKTKLQNIHFFKPFTPSLTSGLIIPSVQYCVEKLQCVQLHFLCVVLM